MYFSYTNLFACINQFSLHATYYILRNYVFNIQYAYVSDFSMKRAESIKKRKRRLHTNYVRRYGFVEPSSIE